MPSIEIISIDSDNSIYQEENYKFAIQVQNDKIESHRGLFYDFLKNLKGTIIHLGNSEFKKSQNEGFFAGNLINWENEVKNDFKFLQEFEVDLKNLIKLAQKNSTKKTIYFLSDYQFSKLAPRTASNNQDPDRPTRPDKNPLKIQTTVKTIAVLHERTARQLPTSTDSQSSP